MLWRSENVNVPPVTSEDDPGYANQGYSRAVRIKCLREGLLHCKAAERLLRKAIEPMEFDDDVDSNPEGDHE